MIGVWTTFARHPGLYTVLFESCTSLGARWQEELFRKPGPGHRDSCNLNSLPYDVTQLSCPPSLCICVGELL